MIPVIKQIERPLHCRLILFNEKMLQSRPVTERASVYTSKRKKDAGVERTFFFSKFENTKQRIKSFSSATGAKPWNCIPLNTRSLPKRKFEVAIRHLA